LSSELPSGFKNREEYNKYMRKYNQEYRERLKQKAIEDYIEKMKALNEEKIDNMLLEAEIKALHVLLNSLLTDPNIQNEKVREAQEALEKLPDLLAEARNKATNILKQEIVKGIPEIEKQVDQTFAEVLKEAQTRLSKAELNKRLTAAYKGLADESQSELEKSLKKFYLI